MDYESGLNLKNAVEKAFTAKTPRPQYPVGALRTYSKAKIHLFGEDTNQAHFYLCSFFSLASLRLCGGIFILTAFFRLNSRHTSKQVADVLF